MSGAEAAGWAGAPREARGRGEAGEPGNAGVPGNAGARGDLGSRGDPLGDARRRRAGRARQVADVLRRQVLSGVFAAGMLPAEPRLATEFGVSRNAVRDALDLLRARGAGLPALRVSGA